MQSKAIIIFSLAAAVLADSPISPIDVQFPECTRNCIPQLGKLIGCEPDNVACFCHGRNQIAHMVAPCLMATCTGDQMAEAQELLEQFCTRMGEKRDVKACPGGNCPCSGGNCPVSPPVCTSGTCPSAAPIPETMPEEPEEPTLEPGPVVCPSGGAAPCPTSVPAPPVSNGSTPAPPAVNPPVVAGSVAVQAGLGLMGAALLVGVSVL